MYIYIFVFVYCFCDCSFINLFLCLLLAVFLFFWSLGIWTPRRQLALDGKGSLMQRGSPRPRSPSLQTKRGPRTSCNCHLWRCYKKYIKIYQKNIKNIWTIYIYIYICLCLLFFIVIYLLTYFFVDY